MESVNVRILLQMDLPCHGVSSLKSQSKIKSDMQLKSTNNKLGRYHGST